MKRLIFRELYYYDAEQLIEWIDNLNTDYKLGIHYESARVGNLNYEISIELNKALLEVNMHTSCGYIELRDRIVGRVITVLDNSFYEIAFQ